MNGREMSESLSQQLIRFAVMPVMAALFSRIIFRDISGIIRSERNSAPLKKKDQSTKKNSSGAQKAGADLSFKEHIEKMKQDYLLDLLSSANGNMKEACTRSGLSKSQLYRLMQQYNLKIR